jgi:translation initiation factor 3 subunit J
MYVNFINEFIRELCLPLKDADVRKVANTLSTLANEKQKQIREKEKPKKKGTIKLNLIFPSKFYIYFKLLTF